MSKAQKTTHEVIAYAGFPFSRAAKDSANRFPISLRTADNLETVATRVVSAVVGSDLRNNLVITKVFASTYNFLCVHTNLGSDQYPRIADFLRAVEGVPQKLTVKSNKNFTETVWESDTGTVGSVVPASVASSGSATDTFRTLPMWTTPERIRVVPYVHHPLEHPEVTVLTAELRAKMVAFLDELEASTHARHGTEQGSEAWLRARSVVVTASTFGTAVGHNKYSTPMELVAEKIGEPKPTNEAMRYGTEHEDIARTAFWTSLKTSFATDHGDGAVLASEGLMTTPKIPWMAVSPDNILVRLVERDGRYTVECRLVEYKCPFGKRKMASWPYANEEYRIPIYYYDQIQGIMGYVNECVEKYPGGLQSAYFVAWTECGVFCMDVPFDPEYYKSLKRDLWSWYLQMFVPSLILGKPTFVPDAEPALSDEYFC